MQQNLNQTGCHFLAHPVKLVTVYGDNWILNVTFFNCQFYVI